MSSLERNSLCWSQTKPELNIITNSVQTLSRFQLCYSLRHSVDIQEVQSGCLSGFVPTINEIKRCRGLQRHLVHMFLHSAHCRTHVLRATVVSTARNMFWDAKGTEGYSIKSLHFWFVRKFVHALYIYKKITVLESGACSLVDVHRRFGGTSSQHLQGTNIGRGTLV
jgi:hypothetical protein